MMLHESVVEESGFEVESGSTLQKRQCGRVKAASWRDTIRPEMLLLLLLLLLQSRRGRGSGAEPTVEQ